MQENIIQEISKELKVSVKQVNAVLKLLSEGSTIPFIARYRKEVTGNLDEEMLRKINETYEYQESLAKRKEDIIRLIDEKGMLTDDLVKEINGSNRLVDLEDIYRPFKEKKKTKATEAIKLGLEPLAQAIMEFPNINPEELAQPYINEHVKTIDLALAGAGFIIAEKISDTALFRKWIRRYTLINGIISTKVKKSAVDDKKTYEIYYDFKGKLTTLKSYQILAINRAEDEKVISVSLDLDTESVINYLNQEVVKNNQSPVVALVQTFIIDAYKRLIAPSIERELRSELKATAEIQAIKVFGDNLEKLLLTPPMKEKIVMGFDPAFRTGCKLAVLDAMGNVLKIAVIYPHEPKKETDKSTATLIQLIEQYQIDIIAIGNGTASRESESFVADVIKKTSRPVNYVIVNEAGASVYSASKLAIEEFPNLHVEERSAISIGRRLQDALNELVKIDTKSIGVGQYQHDVNQKALNEMLDFVVTKVVNAVGVNINSASKTILQYVSGLNKTYIEKLYKVIATGKKFNSRLEISKILSPKVYEQAIGFIRIPDGDNILDKTDIHPESYPVVTKLMAFLKQDINNIGMDDFNEVVAKFNASDVAGALDVDVYTLTDIQKSLLKPGRDPRESYDAPQLRSDILTLDDLECGMKLSGTVRNVIDFGAFVDIGLKNDGLIHISKLSNSFVNHPGEVIKVGEIVEVTVINIDKEKQKVGLSLI